MYLLYANASTSNNAIDQDHRTVKNMWGWPKAMVRFKARDGPDRESKRCTYPESLVIWLSEENAPGQTLFIAGLFGLAS